MPDGRGRGRGRATGPDGGRGVGGRGPGRGRATGPDGGRGVGGRGRERSAAGRGAATPGVDGRVQRGGGGSAPGVDDCVPTEEGGATLDIDVRIRRGERTFAAALTVGPGEIAVVLGPSGAGKTSVLRAVAGLVRPEEGTITCEGARWFDAAARFDVRPRDRRIGVVVQELALFPHLSAWRNVAFARGGTGARAAAVTWLERLGLAHRADARPADLSGGERQRVALARALARPGVALLLDEPFSALDDAAHETAAALVRETVAARGIPALVISHDPADETRLGARTYAMVDGVLRPASEDRGRLA